MVHRMRAQTLRLVLAAGLAVLAPMALAKQPARAQLEQFSSAVQNLSASFEQTAFDPDGRMTERSSGDLALARPNRFRWDYLEPDAQRIVADGDNIWIYDVELEQVSVRPQAEDDRQSPLSVLLDPAALEEQYEIESLDTPDDHSWLRLRPKTPDGAFDYVDLGLADDTLVLMRMVDSIGQRTEIRFSDWRRNTALAPASFQFQPPPGVDVVGDIAPLRAVDPIPE